jgi:hypothetical protein
MSTRLLSCWPALLAFSLVGCAAHYRAAEVRANFDHAAAGVEETVDRARKDQQDKAAGLSELQAEGVDVAAPAFEPMREAIQVLGVTVARLAEVAGRCQAARQEVDRLLAGRDEVAEDDPVIGQVKRRHSEVKQVFQKVEELLQATLEQSWAVADAGRTQNVIAVAVADEERAAQKVLDASHGHLNGARAALEQAGWALDAARTRGLSAVEVERRQRLLEQARGEWTALEHESANIDDLLARFHAIAGGHREIWVMPGIFPATLQEQLSARLQKLDAHSQEIRRLTREAGGD